MSIDENGFSVYMDELMPLILESLGNGQTVLMKVRGNSMFPFLLDARDTVFFAPLDGHTPQRGDIFLFQRANGGCVMHRVYSVDSDGVMDFLGDAQYVLEKGIRPGQLVAYVPKVIRKGKTVLCNKGAWRRAMTFYMLLKIKCPKFARLIYRLCYHAVNIFR